MTDKQNRVVVVSLEAFSPYRKNEVFTIEQSEAEELAKAGLVRPYEGDRDRHLLPGYSERRKQTEVVSKDMNPSNDGGDNNAKGDKEQG